MSRPTDDKRRRREARKLRAERAEREVREYKANELRPGAVYDIGRAPGVVGLGLNRIPVGGCRLPAFCIPDGCDHRWQLSISIPKDSGISIRTVSSHPPDARHANERGELLLDAGRHVLAFDNKGRKAARVGITLQSVPRESTVLPAPGAEDV